MIAVWHVPSKGTSLFPALVVSTHGDAGAADNVDDGRLGWGMCRDRNTAGHFDFCKKLLVKKLIPDG